jgi:hypothetical protein
LITEGNNFKTLITGGLNFKTLITGGLNFKTLITGGLNFKTLMTLRRPEEEKAGFGLKKLRLSCDIQ